MLLFSENSFGRFAYAPISGVAWKDFKTRTCMLVGELNRIGDVRVSSERSFIPLNIAVLTVSDSRNEQNDTSGKLFKRNSHSRDWAVPRKTAS